jgi:vacuolar-type H+-ATPase subunit D/Vma8
MGDYFDSRKFVGDAFELVLKNLTGAGKRYEKDISNSKVFQRFLIDFTIVIEQTIKVAVEKEHIQQVEENIAQIKKRLDALEPSPSPQNDPMIR